VTRWPPAVAERLLRRYVAELDMQDARSRRPYASVLRQFHRRVSAQGDGAPLSDLAVAGWLRQELRRSSLRMAIRRAQIVTRFLDWLVARGHLAGNPIAALRQACRHPSTAAVVRALVSPEPAAALERLRGLPPFASHLGPLIRGHIERMRTLGYRYAEARFRHFDAFLQRRPGAATTPLAVLVREYAAAAATPDGHLRRLTVGRVLATALRRGQPDLPVVARDPLVGREAARRCRPPYIFPPAEIERVLATAREFPSPHAPLRPFTLYTMLVLAYCAGLRIGEIVRLRVQDLRWEEQALDIRESKFFKSRRLPVAASTMAVLQQYWAARREAGIPEAPETPLFCHRRGGYAYATATQLLYRVLRVAGLKPARGRVGPRVHDLRHSFVVHRLLAWYREGIDPQAKLPYLWTYLGHRGLPSSLVYLTITQELLHQASERFRAFAAPGLASVAEGP